MSNRRPTRRTVRFCLGLLLCALALPSRMEATYSLDVILMNNWLGPSLQFANANKIAVGRFNHLHAVFADQDPWSPTSDIVYAHYDPLDPNGWVAHGLTNDGLSSEPALAVDSSGYAVIAWVSRPTALHSLGSIYYARQTLLNCYNCWSTPQQVVFLGAEPSIAAQNGTIHLTWTSRDRVQYTSFPITAPPTSPLWLGDVVDFTNCPNTRFHQPSIAFVHPPCQDVNVKVAALLTANEQSTAGPCSDADTHSGPRVYERDNNTLVWSTVFQDVVSDPTPGQPDPLAFSLSLNANRMTGDFYLAWSHEQNGAPQTWLSHATGATWDAPALITSQANHVHVAAKPGWAIGHFRLAVSDLPWNTGAVTMTGRWSGGLSWTAPSIGVADGSFPFVRHPQAMYWSRCLAGQLSERIVYTEAADWSLPTQVATGLLETSPVSCFHLPGEVMAVPDCLQTRASIVQVVLSGGAKALLIDFEETAVVTRLSETGAEITSLSGGTIQATWEPGAVLSSWETGFAVATSRESLRFTSPDVELKVEDLGTLGANGGK